MSTVNFNPLDAAVVPYVSEASPESALLISEFPPEVLSEIFGTLPLTEMPAIRGVCRAWQSVMKDAYVLSKMFQNTPLTEDHRQLWLSLLQNRDFMLRITTPVPSVPMEGHTITTDHRDSVEMLSRMTRIRLEVIWNVGFGNRLVLRGGNYLTANPGAMAGVFLKDNGITLDELSKGLDWTWGAFMVNRNAETWVVEMDLLGSPGDTVEVKPVKAVPHEARRYERQDDHGFTSITSTADQHYWAEGANTQLTFTDEDQVVTIRPTAFESESIIEREMRTQGFTRVPLE